MPFSNLMASKRETSSTIEDSNYDSDDSNVVIFKRRRINIIVDSDSDTNIHNTGHISKYIRIMEIEYVVQDNSFQFVEKSGPQYFLPKTAKPIKYFNLFFINTLWVMMVEETNRYAEELQIINLEC